jgi:transcriptional regulator with GAF, ATPase, and Fis domain
VVERAVIVSQGGPLKVDVVLGPCGTTLHATAAGKSILRKEEMERSERDNILRALERSNGKIYGTDGAAAILRMKPTTLASRIKKLKLVKP